MTLRLTVNRQLWLDHVRHTAGQHGPTLPVVKGNGYGFGRPILFEQASHISDQVAVGTVFEASDVPPPLTPVVLTPAGSHMPSTLPTQAVLTVGSIHHVETLQPCNDLVLRQTNLQHCIMHALNPISTLSDGLFTHL